MPAIPRLTNNQVAPRPLQIAPRQTTPDGLSAVGESLQRVGQVAQQIYLEERVKADRAAVSEAELKLGQTENALLFDPQNGAFARKGKAAMGLPQQVLPQLDKTAGEIESSLSGDRQKAAFRQAFNDRRVSVERDLNRHEAQQREVFYDETDEARLTQSMQSAANYSGSPEKVAGELATQSAILKGMASRKGWDETKLSEETLNVESKTHEAVVGRLLSLDKFDQATAYLAKASPRMRDPAVESLQRRILLEEDRLLRRQEHQLKLASDAVAKDGDKLYSQGQLTSEWIEAHRNTLDPQDYRYFYGKLTGNGEGPRDSLIYADLRDAAGRGEDVRTDARSALQRGQIRASDYDRIVGEVEGQRPGWYKRGSQFISTSAAVSDLNPDPAAAQRKASMLDDWDTWARENPKATDTEAQTAYKRIVDEYAIININNLTLTKRAPSFLVGTRTLPDMDATERATVKAFKDGKISRAELERQAALLKQWRDALAQQPKPQKPK